MIRIIPFLTALVLILPAAAQAPQETLPLETPLPDAAEAPAAAAPPASAQPDSPISLRYWDELRDIISQAEAQDAPAPGSGGAYLFDALGRYRAWMLLLAARESVYDARWQHRNASQAEVDQQIRENVTRCLEFYPHLAEDEHDIERLLEVLVNPQDHAALREYLIRRSVPGIEPPSLFAEWWQEQMAAQPETLVLILPSILAEEVLDARVLESAAKAHQRLTARRIGEILALDPAARKLVEEEGLAFGPELLNRQPPLKLTKGTQERLEAILSENDVIVRVFLRILRSEEEPEANKRIAAAAAARYLQQLPMPNPELLKRQLLMSAPAEWLPEEMQTQAP